jgi:hypothetical protein
MQTKQKVPWRTSRLLSLIRHGPHWKRRVQQFFYCCVCIRYRGDVSTESFPSNGKGIYTEPLPSNYRGLHTETAEWSHKPTLFFFSKIGKAKKWLLKRNSISSGICSGGGSSEHEFIIRLKFPYLNKTLTTWLVGLEACTIGKGALWVLPGCLVPVYCTWL